MATADPNELMRYMRVNCRFCWGIDHNYQWTVGEFKEQFNTRTTRMHLNQNVKAV